MKIARLSNAALMLLEWKANSSPFGQSCARQWAMYIIAGNDKE